MARGQQEHQAHQAAVAALGRGLSRRSGGRCELCGERGSMQVVEVPPALEEPDESRAVLLCSRCAALAGALAAPKKRGGRQEAAGGQDAVELRFLETAVWSEVEPAQLLAVRLVRGLAERGVGWASEVLEGLYLDPGIEVLV